jgi:hypothetical protein
MKNCKSILCVVLGFALACAIAATAADAPKLTFTFSKANVPGTMQTGPSGINNAGVMVGEYVDKNSVSHGYILSGKKLTTLDDPGPATQLASPIQFTSALTRKLAAGAAAVGVLPLAQPVDAKIIYTKTHQVIGEVKTHLEAVRRGQKK